jgi:carbon storage regulator
MLVLSRKLGQTIIINGNVRVTVVSIRGNQIRLGIEAPNSVKIFREELCAPADAAGGSAEPSPALNNKVMRPQHERAAPSRAEPRTGLPRLSRGVSRSHEQAVSR